MTEQAVQTVQRLRRIRADVAGEIDTASRQGDTAMMTAAVRARDALNEMLIAAGDEETARCEERHASLAELNAMAAYSGVGCPDCGSDADVDGDGVEIDGSVARQEVTCLDCDKIWVNRYQFDGMEQTG